MPDQKKDLMKIEVLFGREVELRELLHVYDQLVQSYKAIARSAIDRIERQTEIIVLLREENRRLRGIAA